MLSGVYYRYCYRFGWPPLLGALGALWATPTFAQDELALQSSTQLQEKLPRSVLKDVPTFLFGDHVTSRIEEEVVVEGNAEIRKTETVIRAKRMEYNQETDNVKLLGDVRLNQAGNRFEGPELELNLTDYKGFFDQPNYQFYQTGGHGKALRVDFVSERNAIANFASYSTCKRPENLDGKPWKPDWILNADSIDFNMDDDIATAKGVHLRFQDVPILATPYFTFPLSGARTSGFLSPSFTSDNQSGFIFTQPYYWNIAPNRDATFTPSTVGKRGINYEGEFRYLEPNSMGTMRADYLPNDKLTGGTRWAYALDQRNIVRMPWAGANDANLSLKLNRAGDNNYGRDFTNLSSSLSQRLLNNEMLATTSLGGWSSLFRMQRWQTLQDPLSPIVPPFDRTQINTKRGITLPSSVAIQMEGDLTDFQSNPALTGQPNGSRAYTALKIAKPWTQPWGFVTPKIQWHGALYHVEQSGQGLEQKLQRSIPTLSLDGGLFFERSTNLFGRDYTQTLEPRAFYVRTPYFNQSAFPNYDSAVRDFNFSTIYTENTFAGDDRISDMSMLTLGVNSKFLNPNTGAQLLNLGAAQRFSFIDQQVALPNTPLAGRLSDYLLGANAQILPSWTLDSVVQVATKSGIAERTTLGTRFSPSNYRTVSAAYRFQRDASEQLDLSWQWPLGDLFSRADEYEGASSIGRGLGANRWYSVARLNYSMLDKRLVNAIAGLEYDADCWLARVVLEKTQIDSLTINQRIMLQLEFSGFSRVGTNPLAALRGNIPRYQNLREQISSPSRFSQYD